MLSTALLLGLMLAATVTDVLRNKIYNWSTYSGILAGLALSAVQSAWLWADGAYWLGGPALLVSVNGLLTCGVLMIVCFSFFPGIGGGDVKLMAMIGTFLGAKEFLGNNDARDALLWTFVVGACFGLIVLVWRVGPVTTVFRVVRLIATRLLRLSWLQPLSDEERQALKPPVFLAPSALVAAVIVKFGLVR